MNETTQELDVPLGQPIELVALAIKTTAIRCRIVSTGQPITLRKVRDEVEGEILTVVPSKVWRYNKTYYMSGVIQSKRIDVQALKLKPLTLNDKYEWNPEEEYWGEPDDPLNEYFKPIINFGVRDSYEMEQVIPFQDPEDIDSDPIFEASELYNSGNYQGAYKIMEKILTTDLRCLDAHAHLGNWCFNSENRVYNRLIDRAQRHYEIGVKIGELSLGKSFYGVLPWGRIDNRPFLRCLHGYGLTLWRSGQPEKARKIFEKMLWLNPADNQGIRFLLADVDAGRNFMDTLVNN